MIISGLDATIIIIYILAMLGLGVYLYRKESSEGFFVNNRNTKTLLLLFTVISTAVGAGTVLGVASSAYETGISFGITFSLVTLFGWLFVALFAGKIKSYGDKFGAFTLGDFFKNRYSNRTKTSVSLVILLSNLIFASIQFIAFAKIAEVIGGINFEYALIGAAVITIIYTVLAGLKGDFYTDAIQIFIMIPVFLFLFSSALSQVSLSELFSSLPPEFLNPFNYAGPLFFFAAIVLGIPVSLVSMDVWQRIYAANSPKTAKKALILGGIVHVLFGVAALLLGLLAFHLFPGGEGDSAIYVLMTNLLPSGILGVGFASILAILMSSIDSIIMVASATFTKDFYLDKYPDVPDNKKLLVGRLSALVFGFVTFFIALIFRDIVKLLVLGAQLIIIFAPAILGGFLLKKRNEGGAFWSIIAGFVVTVGTMYWLPDEAFVPGLVTGIIVYLVFYLMAKDYYEVEAQS